MKKVAVVTDSNAGIRQKEAKELGIFVLPMPFTIDDQTYYEDINLTHEEFFEKQLNGAEIFTSQPVVGNVKELWDQILKDYDEENDEDVWRQKGKTPRRYDGIAFLRAFT